MFNDSARIGCDVDEKLVYQDYFFFFNETEENEFDETLLNVIVFGIDSVSRHNFEREIF